MDESGRDGSINLDAQAPRAHGMFTFSWRKKKDQETIDREYDAAVAALRDILQQQQIQGLNLRVEDFPEEFRSKVPEAATQEYLRNMLQEQRKFQHQQSHAFLGEIESVVPVLPHTKEVSTRAIKALTNVLTKPTPENVKELFNAQHALTSADRRFKIAVNCMAGIGGSVALSTFIVMAVLLAATVSTVPPALGILFGFLLVGGTVCAAAGFAMGNQRDDNSKKDNQAKNKLYGIADVMDKCGDVLESGLRQIGLAR